MYNLALSKLFRLDRGVKRAIQVAFDAVAIAMCFWLAMILRLDGVTTTMRFESWAVLVVVVPLTVMSFVLLGLYRAVVRFIADRALRAIMIGVAVSAISMFGVSQALDLFVPRSVPAIYFALLLIVVGGTRILMRTIYLSLRDSERVPVLIYGAGEAGRQIVQALEQSRNYRPALLTDDDQRLHSSEIAGLRIVRPNQIERFCAELGIKTALLPLSHSDPAARRHVARMLAGLGLEVRVLPNLSDLISGRVRVSELRLIKVEELLGRDPVPPLPGLMAMTTAGKSVLVTGAGGSIGSELCRQILKQGPKRLVLLDVSEFSLYQILEELLEGSPDGQQSTQIVPVLGSVTQTDLVERTIREHQIDTLFHAAAYKHVPLVEANVIEGVRNNVFGTEAVAEAAGRLGVTNFTLISTDKAVRPTNIMGATKRLAELVMQASAQRHPKTRYCAVRFGNVLASSGSVIPKFERQIAMGGPITVTHPEITRYFMTIPEAAQLVVQASAMSSRGEIYLLDMGEPIKIVDLARTMARLKGRETFLEGVEAQREGAIPISIVGMRPGEKLFEELLVTGKEVATLHPRILCEASEPVDVDKPSVWLARLRSADRVDEIVGILLDLPLCYHIPS